MERTVQVAAGTATLEGDLNVPVGSSGIVLFAHGSGSGRHSPRNRYVAAVLQQAGLATLLLDLLTAEEEVADSLTRHLRFDIALLAERLSGAIDWLEHETDTSSLRVGLFGASTGGGASLVAAARCPDQVRAVVSRGGRPDLAGVALLQVLAPTLLLVGARDEGVIELNEQALAHLRCVKELRLVPNATHLFEEPGALEAVAQVGCEWFVRHLSPLTAPPVARVVAVS